MVAKDTIYRLSVHLAENEWASQENGNKMWNVAKNYFNKWPALENMIVTVYEHAGWWLSYLRDGTIVGTANDMATLSEKAMQWGEVNKLLPVKYLSTIRRGKE